MLVKQVFRFVKTFGIGIGTLILYTSFAGISYKMFYDVYKPRSVWYPNTSLKYTFVSTKTLLKSFSYYLQFIGQNLFPPKIEKDCQSLTIYT